MASVVSFFFDSYPEIFISIASFILICLIRRVIGSSNRPSFPTNWPLVGMLPAVLVNLHRVHDWATELLLLSGCNFNIRGPWFISMDIFVTADPANVRHIFNSAFPNFPKGLEFSEIFGIVLGNGIFNADDDSWRAQRRAAHGVFNALQFRSFVSDSMRVKVEKDLLSLLDGAAEDGIAIDLQNVFLRLTFDTTSRLIFGVDPGCLSPGFPAVPFASAVDDSMQAAFFRHVPPPLWWKTLRRLRIGTERKLADAHHIINSYIAEVIRAKQDNIRQDENDLLSSYIANPPQDVEGIMSDEFLIDTAMNFMLAGRDTTGAALTWFFWLLTQNPEAENNIIEELESCSKTQGNIEQLVYLHAALCEALRLYPPVPFEHKAVLKPETLPSSHEVKPGMKILISTYAMGRMEGVWGKDCAKFKPERWILENGKLKHVPSYKFFSFNSGPRTCLGKEVAFTQMKIVAAAVIPKYRFQVVKGHVVKPRLSIILHMKNGLMVKVSKRS